MTYGGLQSSDVRYRGTSPTRKRTPLGPYRRSMPRVLGGSQGGGRFPVGEVPLYAHAVLRLIREAARSCEPASACMALLRDHGVFLWARYSYPLDDQ